MVNWQIATGSNASTVKSRNLTAILYALLQYEPVSRARLSELTGLSATTITNLVAEIIEQGIVTEEGTVERETQRGAGRPRTALRMVPDARSTVGIHIGVGNIHIAVSNLWAEPVHRLSFTHPLDCSPETVIEAIAARTQEAIAQSGVDPGRIVGVGVGASGLVDPQTGVNVFAPNLGWRDVPLRDRLAQQLGFPVTVENNVRAMALGEALFGAGREARSLAFIYASTGVGAGLVVDGQIYRGSRAGAGEIGHTIIIPEGGDPCRCGNTGCLETLISKPAIVNLAQDLARQHPHGILATQLREGEGPLIARVFSAARLGDAATQTMLEKRAFYLGIALANLVNVFNPERIFLAGSLAQGFDLLQPVTEQTLRERSFANLGDSLRLQTASFGAQAGVVGAAALALNQCFYRQFDLNCS